VGGGGWCGRPWGGGGAVQVVAKGSKMNTFNNKKYVLNNFLVIETNKFNIIVIFLTFIIAVRGGHYDCCALGTNNPSYATAARSVDPALRRLICATKSVTYWFCGSHTFTCEWHEG
jgi:hypothetical protein